MTLSLLYSSRQAAYLTGDFRFTYSDGHPEDDLSAQKLVPVIKYDWSALVSFCGIAKTSQGLDVGNWIAEQSRPDLMREPFADFIGRLNGAGKWLAPVRGCNPLTISMAGFRRKRPFVLCLSNHQDLEGHTFDSGSQLRTFELQPQKPYVRVFGDTRAVSPDERFHLLWGLGKSTHVKTLDLLARVNKAAAERSAAISGSCLVGQLVPTGHGVIVPYGIDPEAEYMPGFVRRLLAAQGLDRLHPATDGQGVPLKPSLRQVAFRTFGETCLSVCEFHNVSAPVATGDSPLNDISKVFWKRNRAGNTVLTQVNSAGRPAP
jgi:hypothetical protein